MFSPSNDRPGSPANDPLSHIYLPQGKTVTRIEYEVHRLRNGGEIIHAAKIYFSDGSELWVDLAPCGADVELILESPAEIRVAFSPR